MSLSLSSLLNTPPQAKRHRDGTHRLVSPEETCARVAPLAPIMGITRVANVTGLDTVGIPVVMVTRPNSRSVSVSQGKGVTLAAAKASGLMESVEGFHAERIEHPLIHGSFEDVRWSRAVIDVDALPRRVNGAYTPNTQMLWIEGDDLIGTDQVERGRKWLPYEMVHLNYALPLPTGAGCFQASSNGLASGNSKLEAVCHAITEVIERDAATLWHLSDATTQATTRLDLTTITNPICRDMVDKFQAAGVAVAVWDITSDTGVPAFLARVAPREDAPAFTVRPASGMGCHPHPGVALSRALTEAAQSRLTFISGARDDMPRGEYLRHLDPATMNRWRDLITGASGTARFNATAGFDGDTHADDLRFLLERLRAVGIAEVMAVDLTKPMFGVPVVRVVIPGLEGMCDSPEYALGRRAQQFVHKAAAQ